MFLKRSLFSKRLGRGVGIVALLLSGMVCQAADDGPTTTEMMQESLRLMEAGNYPAAIDSMYMYLSEIEGTKAPRVIAIAQDMRFKMITLLIKTERLDEAASALEEYLAESIVLYRRQAMKMLASCYFEIDSYEECITATTNALAFNANPELFIEIEDDAKTDEEKEEEEDAIDELDDVEPELPYSDDDIMMLNLTLGESYYAEAMWEECIAPFTYVIENTDNEQRKGYGIMQVINALIEIPDFDRITGWIPQLYRTTARFDIRVNLALMNAASALNDAGKYDSALPLYRMILPRDELIAYQEGRLRELRIADGLPPEMDAEMTEDEKLLFGVVDEEPVAGEAGVAVDENDGKSKELIDLERLIAALKEMEPYESDINYHMAQLYNEVERYWEGLAFFTQVYSVAPDGDLGERAIYEIVDSLLNKLNEPEDAKEVGFEYMSANTEGMTPRLIAYLFTGFFQKSGEWPPVKSLLPYLDGLVRTNDATIVQYDTELYYMQAVADLVMQNYELSEQSFQRILDEFPGNHQEGNCLYWLAMSKLFLQKYAEAGPVFDEYIEKVPAGTRGSRVDEALFQGGICLFGQELYDEATERFSLVIETYPESVVLPDACSMRGDIYGSKGDEFLDLAVVDYQMAIDNAKKVNQATYAVFQMATIFEAEERNQEIIDVVEGYLEQYGDEADIAKALFWIGKTRINQGLIEEAVATYVDAIVMYGKDVRQDGVDLMIAELVKVSAIWLDMDAQAKLVEDLQNALDATSNLTLQLRLRVTMALLDRTEIELGKQLIEELPNLDNASPPILATICDASFEMEDYSRAEELLDIFHKQFEDSEYMRAAYKLLGFSRYTEKDYEGALATIEEAQELYGTDADVAWAQLMKAAIFFDRGQLVEARDSNMNILNVPSWRGAPVAQATFQLGLITEAEGDYLTAFGFYQRTYFQYKGHAGGRWAAEAYLASARCLQKLGRENDRRNTYRAMLFDRYVNDLPQAEEARTVLGAAEVDEIQALIDAGTVTNITIEVETEALTVEGSGTSSSVEADLSPVEIDDEAVTNIAIEVETDVSPVVDTEMEGEM